ncbi:MAG: pentapeptide repeat-containing protein [bacterium]|nr:MAG: pentapeptide repeat-containing protein [bacterium]
MANEEHLKILNQGVDVWNQWRNDNPNIKPDLSLLDLSRADLCGANFIRTNLSGTNLSSANLWGADFNEANLIRSNLSGTNLNGANLIRSNLSGANLIRANLWGANLNDANLIRSNLNEANLSRANLIGSNLSEAYLDKSNLSDAHLNGANLTKANLSGAVINELTQYRKIKGCQIGVNGFWCRETDSAALMTLKPPGNSMQGSNPDAILESLKQARRLHGFSMTLAGIVLLIPFLSLEKIPLRQNIEITTNKFGLLAMPLSIGILSLVKLFMKDALDGAQYLNDRQSAMIVGNFPWVLSKYAGGNWFNKLQSFMTRFVMTFHPLVYLYFWGTWEAFYSVVCTIFVGLLLVLSIWTFILSQRFQKPILFDTNTESEQQSDIEKLTEAVEEQTSVINKMVGLLKPKQDGDF